MVMRIFVLLLLLSCCGPPVFAARVAGKVAVNGSGTSGVRVMAYPLAALSLAAPPPFESAATGPDGIFALDLPQGQYYLLAHGGGWFGYYGRNPVMVPEAGVGELSLPLVAEKTPLPEMAPTIETGIAGQVLAAGKPVANALVFAYPDLSAQFRGFGLAMSAPTGADGFFELPLPAGSYYLLARVRHGDAMAGPLTAGDLFGYLPGNPVVVGDKVSRVALPMVTVPDKIVRNAAAMFGSTRISGVILDRGGKPMAGLQALLYTDEAMLNRPLYVSAPTGPDGVFHLSFPSGGHYYLAARNSLGGTPAPGELYGRYRGESGSGLKLATGESLSGVTITVEEVW